MLENKHVKMSWDLEYNKRKESTARSSDVKIKDKERKGIHLVDIACPSEKNKEKRQMYQQIFFEVRER